MLLEGICDFEVKPFGLAALFGLLKGLTAVGLCR